MITFITWKGRTAIRGPKLHSQPYCPLTMDHRAFPHPGALAAAAAKWPFLTFLKKKHLFSVNLISAFCLRVCATTAEIHSVVLPTHSVA